MAFGRIRTSGLAALSLLGLLAPPAVAGPPEGVSGRMVLDQVADGLRQYRKETNEEQRVAWLKRLAPRRDPRVALVLFDRFDDITRARIQFHFSGDELDTVMRLLHTYYLPPPPEAGFSPPTASGKFRMTLPRGDGLAGAGLPLSADRNAIREWWKENEVSVRRRAQELPH